MGVKCWPNWTNTIGLGEGTLGPLHALERCVNINYSDKFVIDKLFDTQPD